MAKWAVRDVAFREIEPTLLVISAPGTRGIQRYAYLLKRRAGNILVHGPDDPKFYDAFADVIDQHGGVALQLLTHKDEAAAGSVRAWKTWQAPIKVHAFDEAPVRRKTENRVPLECFDREHRFAGLQALWLPGHSVGFSCFRWHGANGVYLFSGDLVVPTQRGWRGSGDLNAYRYSLNRLRRMKFDYLLPNGGRADLPPPIALRGDTRSTVFADVLDDLERRNKARAKRHSRSKT